LPHTFPLTIFFLFTQGCRLDPAQCPHVGCRETKLLLLHVKQCPAGPEFDCPEGVQGCQQARKLLAHYRRCSTIRARQAGPGRRIVKQQTQHFCLVCSLVARHARTVLEGGKAPSLCVSVDAKKLPEISQTHNAVGSVKPMPVLPRSTSVEMMPPPPPRPPQTLSASTSNYHKMESRISSEPATPDQHQQTPWPSQSTQAVPLPVQDQQPSVYGSPPTTPQLMRRGIEAVAVAAAPASLAGGTTDPSMLGKSVDSSRGSFMHNASLFKGTNVADSVESPSKKQCQLHTNWNLRRRRAESYDERRSIRQYSQVVPSNSLSEFTGKSIGNDPTVETMFTNSIQQEEDIGEDRSEAENSFAPKKLMLLRKRSSSCGVLSSLVCPGGCDTIDEESHPSQHQPQMSEKPE